MSDNINVFSSNMNNYMCFLDLKGNIKLTYQCNWISIDKRVSIERLLDEQEGVYCAPELGRMDSVSPAVDWWSLGKGI